MEDVNILRKNFQKTVWGHSNFLALNERGMKICSDTGSACYSNMYYVKKRPIDRIFLFFEESDENKVMWADFVTNRSCFADAFITKDVKEGFALGFEVDTEADADYVRAASIVLRHPFEFSHWDFRKFVSMGFSEVEAYALCVVGKVVSGKLYRRGDNKNHLVVQNGHPFASFEGTNHKWDGGQTYKKGIGDRKILGDCVAPNSETGAWGDVKNTIYIDGPVTKDNLKSIIDKIKKIKG